MPKAKKTEPTIVEEVPEEVEFEIPDFDEEEEKFSDSEIAGIADLAEEILRGAQSSSTPKQELPLDPPIVKAFKQLDARVTGDLVDLKEAVTHIALTLTKIPDTAAVLEIVNDVVVTFEARLEELSKKIDSIKAPSTPQPVVNKSPSTVVTSGSASVKPPEAKLEGPASTIRVWLSKLPKNSQYGFEKIARAISQKLNISERDASAIICDQADLVSIVDGQLLVK